MPPRKSQSSQEPQSSQQPSQSSRKGKRQHREEEDDDGASQSQSQSQAQRGKFLSPEEERKGVGRIVKLLLCKDEYKKAVSRSEITIALKGEGLDKNVNVNALIQSAEKRFLHVFGFELVTCSKAETSFDATLSQSTQGRKGGEKLYILRNALKTSAGDQDPDAPQLDAAAAAEAVVKARVELIELTAAPQPTNFPLVLNVLTMIAISEYKMKGTDLIAALRQLNPDLKPGQTIEDLLEMLKAQLYIDVTTPKRVLEEDQRESYYFLGLRAEKEITRARIVSYLELINGEKLKGQDRKRLLPRENEADDDEEMVDA